MRRIALPILASLFLAAFASAPADAQLVPADAAEVAAHALTGAEVDRFLAIVAAMEARFAADQNAFAGTQGGFPSEVTLDQVAARYDSVPALVAVLAEARVTPREFARMGFALTAAWRFVWDPDAFEALPAGVERDNARLVLERRMEIEPAFVAMRSMARDRRAETPAPLPADWLREAEAMDGFRFTEHGIGSFGRAVAAIIAAFEADPATFEAEAAKPIPLMTVDALVARLGRVPAAGRAVREAGMQEREFARWMLALDLVARSDALLGATPVPDEAPEDLRANLRFYAENRKRMEAIVALLQMAEP